MKQTSIFLTATMLAVSACTMQASSNYSVTATVSAEGDNTMVYLCNFDGGAKVDSVVATGGMAKFTGTVEEPFMGRLIINGARGPIFVVEQGDITIASDGTASGTPLNQKLEKYSTRMGEIQKEYGELDQNDSIQAAKAKALEEEYMNIPSKAYAENAGNPLGLFWFLQQMHDMDLAMLRAEIAKNPSLASSKSVKSYEKSLLAAQETSVGKHYKDFSVEYDGKTEKLSDYVKPGRYALVDFWASWCGPCMRQAKVIKELYNKYKDKGLDVVGVAVWDEPANTINAIKTHGLEWPCIINAQTIPTDLYGISGIPCIILINPEGIIVSRDKQGQDLIEDVDKAMESFTLSSEISVPDSVNTVASDTAAIF